ncbi:MAG: DUF3375 domain-containing protein [bacterium]|nr:DUF3375 domain-containing protein [bacterium]
MDYYSITELHKTDASILALRKEWLPLAVSFLHLAFKRKHQVSLPYDIFREQLDNYIENTNNTLIEDNQHRHDADYYINQWINESNLIRRIIHHDGYIIQLSQHGERLIGWFEELQNRKIIGTESRLMNILSLLDDIVTRSTEDVEKRLHMLYSQRNQIDIEIERIQETGQVDGLSDVQIKERLNHISEMASQLLRDFSLVEERFRDMARTIQQAQLNPNIRRGEILGSALDADEQLELSDEGQSFRAFYELLIHPEQRGRFDELIRNIFDMQRLTPFVGENVILQRLTSHLLDAGERVNQSNQRLAEHLRRIVDTRNITESRRIQTLSREIKHMISQLSHLSLFNSPRTFYTIEGEPNIELPLERPLYTPAEQIIMTERPYSASNLIDDDALMTLYSTFYIDDTLLHENIKRMLMSRKEVTLSEVITSYPITHGIAEVIAYLMIATDEPNHLVDRNIQDIISIKTHIGDERDVIVPRVIFRRETK